MAKPLTSWLVPSFSQHNLLLVVLGRCFHVSMMKFEDKFAEIYKFQICCTDVYLIRLLLNTLIREKTGSCMEARPKGLHGAWR